MLFALCPRWIVARAARDFDKRPLPEQLAYDDAHSELALKRAVEAVDRRQFPVVVNGP
jgi:hypothetical protein